MKTKLQSIEAPLRKCLDSAILAAFSGGEILLERFGKSLDIGSKSRPADLVTDADRASEKKISDILMERHPDHAFLAEEGTVRDGSALRWVVDPLDGTVNFAHGIPHWCISIALEDDSGVLLGLVYDPIRSETFFALRGAGSYMISNLGNACPEPENAAQIHVTEAESLGDALLATGFAYDPVRRSENIAYLDRLLLKIRGVRRMGSAALDLSWVACGRFDGYWEVGLKRWDIAAGILLVREAGGRATGFEPGEDPLVTGRIVAGGNSIHLMCISKVAV